MMDKLVKYLITFVSALCCWVVAGLPASAQQAPVPDELIASITAAAPDKATVKPQKARRLLVFTLCKGYYHESIPVAAKALEILGSKTGAFETEISDDIEVFRPASLARFDAVCFDNTTGEILEDPELRASLMDFVKGGKGVVGIHASTDCNYTWPEYGEMMGGFFDGHPWTENVGVKLDDPSHPLLAAFKGQAFTVFDEIYQLRDPYSRKNLRVLLSLDIERTDMTKPGIKRADKDFAVSYIRSFGEGRVFYCSLGHMNPIFTTPAILQFYLDGIQFALGDLKVDTTPSADLSEEYLEKAKEIGQEEAAQARRDAIPEAVEAAMHYNYGEPDQAMRNLENVVRAAAQPTAQQTSGGPGSFLLGLIGLDQESDRELVEDALLKALDDKSISEASRTIFIKHLYLVGSDDSACRMAKMLDDDETADLATYVLTRMQDTKADRVLCRALGRTEGSARLAVIDSLGMRQTPSAAGKLARLASGDDPQTAGAAMWSLGEIGTAKAAHALLRLKAQNPLSSDPALDTAIVHCAVGCAADGRDDLARRLYGAVYLPQSGNQLRVAAFQGLADLCEDNGVQLSLEALLGDDFSVQAVAADRVRQMTAQSDLERFSQALALMNPFAQKMLINALADTGRNVGLAAVSDQVVDGSTDEVRVTAIQALGKFGDISSIRLLAQTAADGEGDIQAAARRSLAVLAGEKIDENILRTLDYSEDAVRIELIQALATRGTGSAIGKLMQMATDPNPEVRGQSFAALKMLATEKDLPALVELLVRAGGSDELDSAAKAVTAVALRSTPGVRVEAISQALATAQDPAVALALLDILGKVGDDASLPVICQALNKPDEAMHASAVRALAGWKDAHPIERVEQLALGEKDDTLRVIALRGFIRMAALPSERPEAETLAMFQRALKLATQDAEKKQVLSALSEIVNPGTLELIKPYLQDKALGSEAQLAMDKITQAILSNTMKLDASDGQDQLPLAIDGDMATRWTTSHAQTGGEWLTIDLGWAHAIKSITLDTTPSPSDFPHGYEVYVANSASDWGQPVASSDEGSTALTITFDPPAEGRLIKIVQTGEFGLWWSIHELKVDAESLVPITEDLLGGNDVAVVK